MKRIIYFILVIIPFITGCNKDDSKELNLLVREIAWHSLSNQERATVITDWDNATVSETTYQEKNSYAVTFNTKDDALLGPIIVYIEKKTLVVLGQGLRM